MARRVIFSDLHFGDPDCSLQIPAVRDGLRAELRKLRKVDELILAGDILDTNVSTFTDAMFGPRDPKTGQLLMGLKGWFRHIFADRRFAAKRIIYIPGNHDYTVWDHLCTFRHYLPQVAGGHRPEPSTTPKRDGHFDETFVSGLLPKGYPGELRVKFPDHIFTVAGKEVLVTHGHYLDPKQTMGKNIRRMMESKAYRNDPDEARRKFFQYSAAYQSTANAVSYTRWMRVRTDDIHKLFGELEDAVLGGLRNDKLGKKHLNAAEEYLRYYRQVVPDVFVFGHTHEAGHRMTSDCGRTKTKRQIPNVIDVWNSGCFLDRGKSAVGTFIVTDDSNQSAPIQLVRLSRAGKPI